MPRSLVAAVLLTMLDRASLEKVQIAGTTPPETLSADQADDVLIEAATAASGLAASDPELKKALETLRDQDKSLKVKDAAQRSLAPPAPPNK